MSGNQLFKRGCRVTIYSSAPPTGFVGQNPRYFVPQPNGIVIQNLRIKFKVEKSLEKAPNECEVTITNCAPDTRAFLQSKPLTIQLEAGYDDDLKHVFTGDLRYAYSKVVEADWETTMQLADGDRAYRYARVSRSYPKGTAVVTALKDAAASMGLQLSKEVSASTDLQAQFASGRTLQGPVRDELTRLLAPYGYHWSIQDGRFQALKDQVAAPGTAYLVNQSTGMIKSPEYSAPDKSKKPPILKVESLLYPQLTAGAQIKVESLQVNGVFRINRLIHKADTHADDWTTELECIAQSGVRAA